MPARGVWYTGSTVYYHNQNLGERRVHATLPLLVDTDFPALRRARLETLQVKEARALLRRLEGQLGAGHVDVRGWSAVCLRLEGEPRAAAEIFASLCRDGNGLRLWGGRLVRPDPLPITVPRSA